MQVVAAILVMVLLVTTDAVQARDYDPACQKNCENKCQNVELRALCVELCLRTDCMGRPPGAPGLDEQLDALYYYNRGCTSSMCSSTGIYVLISFLKL